MDILVGHPIGVYSEPPSAIGPVKPKRKIRFSSTLCNHDSHALVMSRRVTRKREVHFPSAAIRVRRPCPYRVYMVRASTLVVNATRRTAPANAATPGHTGLRLRMIITCVRAPVKSREDGILVKKNNTSESLSPVLPPYSATQPYRPLRAYSNNNNDNNNGNNSDNNRINRVCAIADGGRNGIAVVPCANLIEKNMRSSSHKSW